MQKKILLIIPIVLYVISLLLPPFTVPRVNDILPGIFILLIGWAGVLVFQFAWFANPLFFLSLLAQMSDEHGAALKLSVAASALSLNSFTLFFKDQIPSGNGSGIVEHFVGAWFWLGAIWTLMVINIFIAAKQQRSALTLRSSGTPHKRGAP